MICEDVCRFKIYYDYVKNINPLYNKSNSIIWIPFCKKIKKGMWGFPHIKNGIYKIPMDFINPFYLKRYINNKLIMLNKNVIGNIYIPFCFFSERLKVGILLERKKSCDFINHKNILPVFLKDFKNIFPQRDSILFD